MSHAFSLIPLLAAEESSQLETAIRDAIRAAIDLAAPFVPSAMVLAAIVLPFVAGWFIAKAVRMNDYWWRIGLILASISCASLVIAGTWDFEQGKFVFPMGVDLKGGSILVYEVEQSEDVAPGPDGDPDAGQGDGKMTFDQGALMQAISNRINPSGTQEIVVRPYGDRQVEIIIPDVDRIEVDRIKELISTAGALEFRIVASRTFPKHSELIDAAEKQAQGPDRNLKSVRNASGEEVAKWARVARDLKSEDRPRPFVVNVDGHPIRNARTGEIIDAPIDGTMSFEEYIEAQGVTQIDVLMATDDGQDVTGENLGSVSSGHDELLAPAVDFTLRGVGISKFSRLTRNNLPDGQLRYRLGIILDGILLSAPVINSTISERGQISGSFSREEVDSLVGILRAGRLPATLSPTPISENQIGSTLGEDTILRGRNAIALSLIGVLVFILIYYRFAGVVACLALLTSLLLTLALMVLVKAPITLPGLAGLVLTVGMSVDANVLIFERIREEMDRGSGLRMAIMNGFRKATTTIVDANLTTLITALVLYAIGTDQIRGFAVTLILGILMSMFTAIFCSRVTFDIAERTRRLTKLTMMRIIGATNFDFVSMRKIAAVFSIIFIVIGLAAVGVRGSGLFDIDFLGGTSVTMQLNETMPIRLVRQKVNTALEGEQFTLTRVDIGDTEGESVFKVDSAIPDVSGLQQRIREQFVDDGGESLLASYSLKFGNVETETKALGSGTAPETKPETTDPGGSAPSDDPKTDDPKTDVPKTDVPKTDVPKTDDPKSDDPKTEAPKADDPKSDDPKSDDPKSDDPKTDDPKTDDPKTDDPKTDEPKTDEPKTDDPKSDDPKTDVPKTDDPKSDEPKTDVPKSEAPKADEPKSDESKSDESKSDEPKTDEPKTDESGEAKDGVSDDNASVTPFGLDDRLDAVLADGTMLVYTQAADEPADSDADAAPASDGPTGEAGGSSAAADGGAPETAGASESERDSPEEPGPRFVSSAKLELTHDINAQTLKQRIVDAAQAINQPMTYIVLAPENADAEWHMESGQGYTVWNVELEADNEQAKALMAELRAQFADETVWLSSSTFGGKVAGDTRMLAITALLTSLLFIVGYIWFRFQKVVFGLAAVVALLHDVLVTLGAIAISAYVAPFFGFLLVDEFKISLPIVAAFLTIIGYSLNDTIVVFDRIREVRGKSPQLTADMINRSINQTLGRTLLTSLTTLIVVMVLYALGGQGIHGFAFALVVGVVAGTYSSIFVASPVLLWMSERENAAAAQKRSASKATAAS